MRDKLIELIEDFPTYGGTLKEKWWGEAVERLADYLLAEGVIVPPCKVGQTVYVTDIFEGEIAKCEIIKVECFAGEEVTLIEYKAPKEDVVYSYECPDTEIGKTVFLTREEAEKALAERSENGTH